MEFPRLTEPQFIKLIEDFKHSIGNVRRNDSPVADYQMMLLYKIERAYKAIDNEANEMDRRDNNGKATSRDSTVSYEC